MNLLLDTHVVLWWLQGAALDDRAARAIADRANTVWVSAASVWEAAIKQAAGKLRLPEGTDLGATIVDQGFDPLPVGFDHATLAGALPPHHRDPFDRVLVAQALHEGLTLVTRDRALDPYDVPRLAA